MKASAFLELFASVAGKRNLLAGGLVIQLYQGATVVINCSVRMAIAGSVKLLFHCYFLLLFVLLQRAKTPVNHTGAFAFSWDNPLHERIALDILDPGAIQHLGTFQILSLVPTESGLPGLRL